MWEPWGNFGKLYWAKAVTGTGGLWEKKQGHERHEEILAAENTAWEWECYSSVVKWCFQTILWLTA